jgi:hypothetical protein
MALPDARDRRVIRPLVRAGHARDDVLDAASFDRPR